MPRIILLGACLLFGVASARADLDAKTTTPYKLQVVLHFSQHNNMTAVFRSKVEQDLRDSLQATLGELAIVEVVSDHPLLKDVLERGLQHALDGWKSLSDVKTHFVLIDYVQGQYELSARQHDGNTGLASPVVRQEQTDDRLLVAKKAFILVERDFGLVGTIVGDLSMPKQVKVAIQGGARSAALEPWLQKDDVFAVAEIVGQSGAVQRSNRREWTLLQVVELPKDGVCVCRALSRYDWPPRKTAGSQGLRCLKLGTTQGVLKMRLVDDKQAPLPNLKVMVSGQGFESITDRVPLVPTQDGFVQSRKPYKNVAFVLIDDGTGEMKTVPVEIVDDRTVTCFVKVQHGGERLGQFGIRRGTFLRRLDQDRILIEGVWKDLQKEGSMTPQQWLKHAKEGLTVLRSELLTLDAERDQMQKERADMEKDPKIAKSDLFELAAANQLLQGLHDRGDKLEDAIKDMTEQIKSGKFEKQLEQREKWLAEIKKAQGMEQQADWAQAIATYERILAEGSADPGVKKRLAELAELWKIKNQQHTHAREVIYSEWPQCTTAKKMQEKVAEAKHSLEVCKEAGDFLTPLKLFLVNQDHAAQLRTEVDTLKPEIEDDRTTLLIIKNLEPELNALSTEVTKFLAKAKGAAGGK